jgi:hypothetical protein
VLWLPPMPCLPTNYELHPISKLVTDTNHSVEQSSIIIGASPIRQQPSNQSINRPFNRFQSISCASSIHSINHGAAVDARTIACMPCVSEQSYVCLPATALQSSNRLQLIVWAWPGWY